MEIFFELGILVLLVVAAAGIIRAVVRALRVDDTPEVPAGHSHSLELLEERYARGEISRHEFLRKRHDITG